MLAVNNYDEFLKLVEVIAESYSAKKQTLSAEEPGIVVLVGPSGSGKNEIAKGLLEQCPQMQKLVSYTTAENAAAKNDGWYHYVPVEEFRQLCDSGDMFESTTYAHHSYGSTKSDVVKILAEGHHVLTVMDICGAMALKTHFPNVITIYIKRDKKQLLTAILEKDSPTEDKVNRLLAIEAETRNAQICDYTVKFDNTDQAVAQIRQRLGI